MSPMKFASTKRHEVSQLNVYFLSTCFFKQKIAMQVSQLLISISVSNSLSLKKFVLDTRIQKRYQPLWKTSHQSFQKYLEKMLSKISFTQHWNLWIVWKEMKYVPHYWSFGHCKGEAPGPKSQPKSSNQRAYWKHCTSNHTTHIVLTFALIDIWNR